MKQNVKLPRYDKDLFMCVCFAKKLMKDNDFIDAIKIACKYYDQDFDEVRQILTGKKDKEYFVVLITQETGECNNWLIGCEIRKETKSAQRYRSDIEFRENRASDYGGNYCTEKHTHATYFDKKIDAIKYLISEVEKYSNGSYWCDNQEQAQEKLKELKVKYPLEFEI